MIVIPKLSTSRLSVQLKEVSIGDSIRLASMPPSLEQALNTAFLQSAIKTVERGEPNPLAWTVQERTLAIAHYLASVLPDGPDFSLGETCYSDYLDASKDYAEPVGTIGQACGDEWGIRHLTGHAAESIERLAGEFEWPGAQWWPVGIMAAQLVRKGEDASAEFTDPWLLERAKVLARFPESDFLQLLGLWLDGTARIAHLFRVHYDDKGLVMLTKEGRISASARFSVHSGLCGFAKMD